MKIFSAKKDYYRGYGLERDPFPESGIDNIFFTTPEFNQRIELIKHLLQHGQQLLLVLAPAGAGKSTLCKYLQSSVDPGWSLYCIDAGKDMSPEGLAFAVIKELYPAEYARTVPALDRFYKYLEFCDRDGKLPIIMIDNGQLLSPDTLEFILQLNEKTCNDTRFRFVIFAEQEIERLLDDPRIKVSTKGILHNISIPLLTEDQTAAYLEHRLQSSGNPAQQPFTGTDVQQIHKVAGGVPGRINRLARQTMQGPTARWKRVTPGLLRYARNPVILATLIFLVFVLFYIVGRKQAPEPSQRTSVAAAPPVVDSGTASPAPVTGAITPPADSAGQVAVQTSPEPEPVAAPEQAPVQTQPEPTPVAQVAEQTPPPPAPAAVKPKQPPVPAPDRPEALSPQFAGLKDGAWLRAQDPHKYVLQVIGAQDIHTLEKYLQAAPELRRQLIVIATRNAGKPWYVFLYGLYPDHDSAAAAIPRLPAAARKSRPWPRAVAEIRSNLDKLP